MVDLVWVQCPFCKESIDIKRVGKPFIVSEKANGKLHVSGSRLLQCGYCGKQWHSDAPTMKEAFGDDQIGDTSF